MGQMSCFHSLLSPGQEGLRVRLEDKAQPEWSEDSIKVEYDRFLNRHQEQQRKAY